MASQLTPLAQFIEDWCTANGKSASSLFTDAGFSNALWSSTRKGSIPWPSNLKKLQVVMNVPLKTLMLLAGYAEESDYGSSDDWAELTQEEINFLTLYRRIPEENRSLALRLLRSLLLREEDLA